MVSDDDDDDDDDVLAAVSAGFNALLSRALSGRDERPISTNVF